MRTRSLIPLMIIALLIPFFAISPAWPDCDPWGVSTLRGDAQYLPDWFTDLSTIEITPPDEFVYGVIDGSVLPQQFSHIKAKLRNRMDKAINAGTLRAAARYRKRIDYQPDLSADPPTAVSMEKGFSTSLSEPISIDTLASDVPQTFAFDFSNEPIPAGITDLYFIITFQGEIEDLEGPGFAFGIKDLNEPSHFTIWNFSDYYSFFGVPRTQESILSNQDDYDRVVAACPSSELWLYWDKIYTAIKIAFSDDRSKELIYVVEYGSMLPGHYGRIIALFDVGANGVYYLFNQHYTSGGCAHAWEDMSKPPSTSGPCSPSWMQIRGAAINQLNSTGFNGEGTRTARKYIKTHLFNGYAWFCDLSGLSEYYTILNEQIPPANDQPISAAAINFP